MRSNRSISFMDWASPDAKAAHIAGKYSEWQSYKEQAMERWKETEAYIYATDTTSIPGGDMFDHTTHLPLVHELREELISIMYSTVLPNEDFIGFQPFDKESATKEKRKKALAYLKNRHSLNGFRKSIDKAITDLIDYGICIVQVQYVDTTKTGKDGLVRPGYAGPVLRRFSPYDFTMDPTADNYQVTPKILRSLVSMGEFISLAETNEWDPELVKSVVEKRGTYGTVDFSDNKKNTQFTPDGFSSIEAYYASGMVELLYFYGDVFDEHECVVHRDRCVVVVDRCLTLSDEEVLEPNIFIGSWKVKADNLWPQGALDQIIGLNFQINHRENALSTSIDRFIFPDRVQMGDVEIIYNPDTNRIDYLAPEGGGVQDLTPDATVLSYDNQIRKLMDMARMTIGLPPSLQGFRSPGEKTAFEVQTLNDGAYRSFIHKAERFDMDVLEPVLNAELKIGRDHLHSALQVQTTSPEGIPTFISITSEDLNSNGKLVPMGSRRFALQNKQLNMLNQLANSNLANLVSAHLNTYALAQVVEELGGLTEFEMFGQFAAIEEQFEQQQLVNVAQQVNERNLSRPTLEEELLNG